MAALTKFYSFVEEMAQGTHSAAIFTATDVLRLALSNTTPAQTDDVLTDITEIAYTNIAEPWPIDIVNTTDAPSGTITITVGSAASVVATASGGSVAEFQFIVLYNDTAASDELIGWYDNGSKVNLTNGQTFTVNFGANLFTVA